MLTPEQAIVILEKNCAIHVGNVVIADEAWQTLKSFVLAQQHLTKQGSLEDSSQICRCSRGKHSLREFDTKNNGMVFCPYCGGKLLPC